MKQQGKNIRVMQIIYSFQVGGSEVVAHDIAMNMNDNVVHGLVALESTGVLRQKLIDAGISTWVIAKETGERIGAMVRIWKAMREFKPDVIHTHHLYELLYAWPGALLTRTQIVHTEHEYFSLKNSKAFFRLRLLSCLCRAITGVNEETSAFLKNDIGISATKVHTIPNGINLKQYELVRSNRKLFGLTGNDLVVGIVARLHKVKDHQMLIHAFRLVVYKLPQTKLLVIGDGPTRQQLESLVSELQITDKVFFLGICSDIPELLSCLDVVVLSSLEEGLPMSILEAMASGKPVVATEVGGVPTVVRTGQTGLLVPVGDSEAMATALTSLLTEPDIAEKMGCNGRKIIEKYYDLKQSLAKYRILYETGR